MRPKNKNWNREIIIFSALSFLAMDFKAGDMVELTYSLNARRTPRFYRKDLSNRKFVLNKGDSGEIKEVMKLPSGNYGVKLALNGKRSGKTAWVYYNVKNPGLQLAGPRSATAETQQSEAQHPAPAAAPAPAPAAKNPGYARGARRAYADDIKIRNTATTKVPAPQQQPAESTEEPAPSAADTAAMNAKDDEAPVEASATTPGTAAPVAAPTGAAPAPAKKTDPQPDIKYATSATATRDQEAIESAPEDDKAEAINKPITSSKIDLPTALKCYHTILDAVGVSNSPNFHPEYAGVLGKSTAKKEDGIFIFSADKGRFYPIPRDEKQKDDIDPALKLVPLPEKDVDAVFAKGEDMLDDHSRGYFANFLKLKLQQLGSNYYLYHLSDERISAEQLKQAKAANPPLDSLKVRTAAGACAKVQSEPKVSDLGKGILELLDTPAQSPSTDTPKGPTKSGNGKS